MAVLIVAEKPSVASRLAVALGGGNQKRTVLDGVSYYTIDDGKDVTYIAAAVGHLFTLRQTSAKHGYPVLDIAWAPSYEVNKASYFTKKYVDVFRALASKASAFVNACDYDVEGSVIGTNVIKFLCSGLDHASRMKFSTTTIPDLIEAYKNMTPLDMNNFYAGEARHTLDWLWGINLSRALTSALAEGSFKRTLSIGRVQGPSLAILANKELDISKFVPKPFWRISALIAGIEFSNTRGDILEKKVADDALAATNANASSASVEDVKSEEQMVRPYPPFDLTGLQLEASRALKFDPSATLALAQSLYERAYISYPRTSSQKLPPTLGLSKIIGELAKNPAYADIAKKLIDEKRFKPNEGFKTDEAHPAIYPTGVMPKTLTPLESKLYDLITKRFLACFAAYAKLAKTKITIKAGDEKYVANGTVILEKGWLDFYGYARMGEKTLPELKKGSAIQIEKAYVNELMTQPPRRYNKAMLIAELERKDLGTKATRAQVIDTLFKRGYIEGTSIHVTDFGMSVFNALKEHVPMIVDESTTRTLEEDMEKITKGQKSEQDVIDEGKQMLLSALKAFDSSKAGIAKEMSKVLQEAVTVIGKCPTDGGNLVVRRSRLGKSFAGCDNYPKCTTTYSLPQGAKVSSADRQCPQCKSPMIKVEYAGKPALELCIDPKCPTRLSWKRAQKQKEKEAAAPEVKPAKPAARKPRKAKGAVPKAAAKKPSKPRATKKRANSAAKK